VCDLKPVATSFKNVWERPRAGRAGRGETYQTRRVTRGGKARDVVKSAINGLYCLSEVGREAEPGVSKYSGKNRGGKARPGRSPQQLPVYLFQAPRQPGTARREVGAKKEGGLRKTGGGERKTP